MQTFLVLTALVGLLPNTIGGENSQCQAALAATIHALEAATQAIAEANQHLSTLDNVNLALNKPAFLKVLYHASASAGYAVDGNTNPDRDNGGTCAICDNTDNAWWAVDLGTSTHVGVVRILARLGSNSENQLEDFVIGVSEVSPVDVAPTLNNYDICAEREDAVPNGKFVDIECGKDGRYVIVQRTDVWPLTICEFEVYTCYL